MLTELQALLGGRVRPTWADEMTAWGTLVKLYREYAEGKQRSFLTTKQRLMLNIKANANEDFTLNYCDMVIQAMAERLTVTGIEGVDDPANAWSSDVLAFNRFDGLQMDVTEASIQDGVTFVMVGYDNAAQKPVIAHEPAWDGDTGLLPVYDRTGGSLIAAVKVWYEPMGKRVNLYTPDSISKYTMDDVGKLTPLRNAEPWRDRNGKPLGVPVVAVGNRKKGTGRSEIAAVIPSQDSLNRSVIDMMMASGLTAFQIKVAIGFTPPDTVAPGDWVVVGGGDGVSAEQKVDAFALEQGQLVPFIQHCNFHIDQIGTVSRTPLPQFMGTDASSGESLKQKEVGLIGKVERYQVKAGNAWEDVLTLAARVQAAYGATNPPVSTWTCKWAEAQKRNDLEVITIAEKIKDFISEEDVLRWIAPVLDYDEKRIQQVLERMQVQRQRRTTEALQSLPDFSGFGGAGGFGAN